MLCEVKIQTCVTIGGIEKNNIFVIQEKDNKALKGRKLNLHFVAPFILVFIVLTQYSFLNLLNTLDLLLPQYQEHH
jgi:hypothetical protein